MARTVLAANSKRRATCRAEALSQASPTASSKRFENGLARQLQHLLALHPTVRAFHPVNLDVDRGLKLAPGQVTYGSFAQIVEITELPPATGAVDLPVARFRCTQRVSFFRRSSISCR